VLVHAPDLGVQPIEMQPMQSLINGDELHGLVGQAAGFSRRDMELDPRVRCRGRDLFFACGGGDHPGEARRQVVGGLAAAAGAVPEWWRPAVRVWPGTRASPPDNADGSPRNGSVRPRNDRERPGS
jgi:hypothetical protein